MMPQIRVVGEQIVDVVRHVRAVEGADAEMDDAGAHLAPLVGGKLGAGCGLWQSFGAQSGHRLLQGRSSRP